MHRIKDARGKESTTLTLVIIGLVPLIAKFTVGGMELPFVGVQPVIGAGEFGLAFAGLMAVWLNREWKEARHEKNT